MIGVSGTKQGLVPHIGMDREIMQLVHLGVPEVRGGPAHRAVQQVYLLDLRQLLL